MSQRFRYCLIPRAQCAGPVEATGRDSELYLCSWLPVLMNRCGTGEAGNAMLSEDSQMWMFPGSWLLMCLWLLIPLGRKVVASAVFLGDGIYFLFFLTEVTGISVFRCRVQFGCLAWQVTD